MQSEGLGLLEVRQLEHAYDFDPTYGYTLEELLRVEPPVPPPDFASFWKGIHERAVQVVPSVEFAGKPESLGEHRVSRIWYTSVGGVRIAAWVVLPPQGQPVERAAVVGHGYGGRDRPDLLPGLEERAALILPCARGLSASRDAVPELDRYEHHVMVGLESRDTYVHAGCVADYMVAVSVLLHLFPQVRGRVAYGGESFGGGIGALLVPWEPRITRAFLSQPSFGHHALRVGLECVGSGLFVRKAYERDPAVLRTLEYFDAAAAARFIRVPTLVAPSLFDPAVPPPGQFAVYNAIPEEFRSLAPTLIGHFRHPLEAVEYARVHERLREFFADF